MKACVFGAGAIGGHVAARLARGGAETSVVARGPHLAAIQSQGLRIETPDGQWTAQLQAAADPAQLGPQDVVFVTVKAPALPSVAAAITPLLKPETAVVFLMNGIPWWYYHAHGGPNDGQPLPILDPGAALQSAIGPHRAIGGVVYSSCTVTKPGTIFVEHTTNRLVLGEPNGTLSPRLEALSTPLTEGGLTIDQTPRIRDAIWTKLLVNLGLGPLGVLTASPPRDFFQEPALQRATRAIVAEAAAIAAAMGCPITPNPDAYITNGLKSAHKTSILQDLERGRPMEIDALYTVPLEMARAHNIETPTLNLLAALTQARARAAGLYPPAAPTPTPPTA